MRKKLLSILVLSVVMASTFVGSGCSPSTLTILSISEGDVFLIKAGTDDWIEAEVGMSLRPGDSVKTGDNSSAEITFFEGSTVELQTGSEVEIASLDISTDTDSTTVTLEQTIGSIIFRVTKIIDPASRYEVETPAGVVAIRGSVMQVYVTEDGTTRATNLEGEIWAAAQGVELQVPEGRQCIIRPDEPPELSVEVTFADPNLEAAIRQAISKPAGPIYASDLDGLTHLNAEQRSIYDLSGLEHCTSLRYLSIAGNQISDISPLASLTGLDQLWVSGNQITDISPLASLTSLEGLWAFANQISDISPLAGLTSLGRLWLSDNQISDISPLGNLTGLTQLDLTFNHQISDISPLANLTYLTILGLSGHQISDIALVVDLSGLIWLYLPQSQISDILPLASLTGLEQLWLSTNQITDISPLTNLTELSGLIIDHNQISDISPLASLTNLTFLGLGSNQITDISPLVDNDGLSGGDTVILEENPLSSDSVNIYIPQLQARGVTVYY